MIFLTTTAIDIDEELMNRCLVLSVDERSDADRGDPSPAAPAPHAGGLAGHARREGRNLAVAPGTRNDCCARSPW